jgi:hypothetical protein
MKIGHEGHQHASSFSALADYDTSRSASLAALFMPLGGFSLLLHAGFHALNIGQKEDELAAIFDALLFPPEGEQTTIISTGEFDIQEVGEELKVSSRCTGNSFTIKGTFSTLREEWKRDIREAACAPGKKPSPKVVELYNKILCEQAIELYQTLADGTSDWAAVGQSVVELTKSIQSDVSEGTEEEDIMTSAMEKLDNSYPRALQDPEQANAFIRHLIRLAVPCLSGIEKVKSWLSNSTENRLLDAFLVAASRVTRSNLLVFCGIPREIAAQIVDYLDHSSLQAMRLVSIAARDQAEKKLIPKNLKFDQLAINSSPDGHTYYEHVNIPSICIKLQNIARKEEASLAQFVVTDNEALFAQFIKSLAKNKQVKNIQLNLDSNGLGKNVRVLMRISQLLSLLPNLTSLEIDGTSLGDRGAGMISELPNLTHLSIRLNQIGPVGAGFIARMSNLKSLDIGSNSIGDKGVELVSSLSKLTNLRLGSSSIGWSGVGSLTKLPKLTSLHIGSNRMGKRGAEAISTLTNLTDLSTGWNQLGRAGTDHISKLTNLTSLDIRSNGLDDSDAQSLSALQNLTSLNIGDNKTGKGAQFISTIPNLTSLYIADNELGDEDAQFIPTMPNLTSLDISSNSLTDATAGEVVKLKHLKNLDIRYNPLSNQYHWLKKNTIGTI